MKNTKNHPIYLPYLSKVPKYVPLRGATVSNTFRYFRHFRISKFTGFWAYYLPIYPIEINTNAMKDRLIRNRAFNFLFTNAIFYRRIIASLFFLDCEISVSTGFVC
ncbi:unnamed protein product, partial [Hymenolepis diminuta]